MSRKTYLLCLIFVTQCIAQMVLLARATGVMEVRCILTVFLLLGWLGGGVGLHEKKYVILLAFIFAAVALTTAIIILFWGWDMSVAKKQLIAMTGTKIFLIFFFGRQY